MEEEDKVKKRMEEVRKENRSGNRGESVNGNRSKQEEK